MRAILYAGKQLQKLQIEEDCNDKMLHLNTVRSTLIRKLILTASSSTVVTSAAKLLSSLDKEAADRGELQNLLIISDGQFPEVQPYLLISFTLFCFSIFHTTTLFDTSPSIFMSRHIFLSTRLLEPEKLFKQQRRNLIH